MKIASLGITNFRNLETISLKGLKKTVVLVGDNASGKSNFIEAIRYLTLTRSHKKITDKQLMKVGEKQGFLTTRAVKGKAGFNLSYTFDRNKPSRFKEIYLGQERKSATDVLGKLLTVHFAIEELDYFLESPKLRRKYFNILFCLYSHKYWVALSAYQKIIKHRNSILKQIFKGQLDREELTFWDQELAKHGSILISKRQVFFRKLNKLLQADYLDLVGRFKKKPVIRYQSSLDLSGEQGQEKIEEIFLRKLIASREQEIKLRQTLSGPQRDRMELVLAGKSLRGYASRGEIRSTILALKVAELSWLEKRFKTRPILLLDDIYSELDGKTKNFLKLIIGKQQTFVTTTSLDNLDKDSRKVAQIFTIKRGKIKQLKVV